MIFKIITIKIMLFNIKKNNRITEFKIIKTKIT